MMFCWLVWILTLLLATGCATPNVPSGPRSEQPSESAKPATSLRISIYGDGKNLTGDYTLECTGPQVSGNSTLPNASKACQLIDEQPGLLAPERPAARACTEIYGGPDRAVITGTHQGKHIDSEFTRTNGCYIAEWDALAPLLGAGGL